MILEDIPASQQGQKDEKNFELVRGEYLVKEASDPIGRAISIVVIILPKALLIPNDSCKHIGVSIHCGVNAWQWCCGVCWLL